MIKKAMQGQRLTQKRAIITGGASGIGRTTAISMASEGAAVVVADLDEGVHETAQQIRDAGGRAWSTVGDVSREDVVRTLIDASIDQHGGLEIMFANAGIVGPLASFLEIPASEWQRVLDVNLMGVVHAVQQAALHMKRHGGGSIVCTASVAGLRAGAGPAHYSASKAAVINFCQTAAMHLTGTAVRVNAVCPGLIETGMTKPLFDYVREQGKTHKLGQLNPTRRAGQPEEVAQTVIFLASDDSAYINGQAIAVDGGLSASHPFVPGRIA
ncbi:MAG: SDR family NAD(P)-dependent oxidoreductase [Myxococcota bacterium]